jgi:hypothetical protein
LIFLDDIAMNEEEKQKNKEIKMVRAKKKED